jgi:hypothetical protein
MPGPGLYVLFVIMGVVLIVAANSRREEMAERVDPYHDPDAGDGHSDPGPEVPHAGDIGTVGVDPHRGWTGG